MFGTMTLSRRQIYYFLAIIIGLTTLLWIGVGGISVNSEEYGYIESLAPIRTFADIFRPFYVQDITPTWYRPFANLTLSLDFLWFQWDGGGHHLTNLFFHLIFTGTVFYFARSIFGASNVLALLLSLAFGLNASHDYNLTADTARDDILVGLFLLWTFLAERKALLTKNLWWEVVAVLSFCFALCSKESAYFVLPLLPWFCLPSEKRERSWMRVWLRVLAPFLVVGAIFMMVHAHFGAPPGKNPYGSILSIGGIIQDLRANLMGAGYILFPLNFTTAMEVLDHHMVAASALAGIISILCIWILWTNRTSSQIQAMVKPLVLFAFTTLPIVGFARWRFYLPSVGLLYIALLFAILVWKRGIAARVALIVLIVPLAIFHISQSLSDQADWRAATQLIHNVKPQLASILEGIRPRPVRLGLISVPAKIGDGIVMSMQVNEIVKRAEAYRMGDIGELTGLTSQAQVVSWAAVNIFSLDPSTGFSGVKTNKVSGSHYIVRAPEDRPVMLTPAELGPKGVSPFQPRFQVGDTVQSPNCLCTIVEVTAGVVKAIDVKLIDTTAVTAYFDGTKFTTF